MCEKNISWCMKQTIEEFDIYVKKLAMHDIITIDSYLYMILYFFLFFFWLMKWQSHYKLTHINGCVGVWTMVIASAFEPCHNFQANNFGIFVGWSISCGLCDRLCNLYLTYSHHLIKYLLFDQNRRLYHSLHQTIKKINSHFDPRIWLCFFLFLSNIMHKVENKQMNTFCLKNKWILL